MFSPRPTCVRTVLAIASALLFPLFSEAATFTVMTTQGDDSVGSLRKAIQDATDGDIIDFDATLDGETIRLNGMQIVIDKNLTIDASSLPFGITISGDQTGDGPTAVDDSRVFTVNLNKMVVMKSLTITGGRAPDGGGTGFGGGLFNVGTLTMEQCVISNNRAGDGASIGNGGGGIYNGSTGTLTLRQCTVANNRAGDGGGGDGDDSDGGRGGGISNRGVLVLEQCTVANNRAGDADFAVVATGGAGYGGHGGGIENYRGTVTLKQCTLANNQAGNGGDGDVGITGGSGGWGGAILNDGDLTVTQCTISRNHAGNGGDGDTAGGDGRGGGIYNFFSSTTVVTDSIIAGNLADSVRGPDFSNDSGVTRFGVNIIGDNTLSGGSASTVFPAPASPGMPNSNGDFVGTSNDPLAPLLSDLVDNGGLTPTMLPLRGSPALNPTGGATDPGMFPNDQRGTGFTRIIAGIQDVGAAEAPNYAVIDAATKRARLSRQLRKFKKKLKIAKRKKQVSKVKRFKKKIKKFKKLKKQLRAV